MARAIYAAMRERSVGLGVMGFHSFLQAQNVPFESAMAKVVEHADVQAHPRRRPTRPRCMLAEERGACPDAADMRHDGALLAQAGDRADRVDLDHLRRHLAGIEPIAGQRLHAQDAVGLLRRCATRIWRSCSREKGQGHRRGLDLDHSSTGSSVQHLDFLTEEEKDVFKTAFELDQRWVIELAADRTPFICQSQSVNLFLPADVDKWDLHMLHFRAWERGIKSLYYLRSKSVQRAGFAGGVEADNTPELREIQVTSTTDYDECLACQ